MRYFIKLSLTLLLFLYLAILTKLVLFKYIPLTEIRSLAHFDFNESHLGSSNLIPFETIKLFWYADSLNINAKIENLVGNIIGFVPFGFILPMLSDKFRKLIVVMLATFYLSLAYEGLQFLTGFGSFDVDDLILNTLGGILGYAAFKILLQMVKFKNKSGSKNISSFFWQYFLN
jgi:glycopeptide antibiotics resistance protein